MHQQVRAARTELTMLRSNQLVRTLVSVLIILATGITTAQDRAGIHVTGTGTVYGEPDVASFDVGINVLHADVSTATAEAADVAEAIITGLVAAGVSETDIRTGSFNVWREDQHSPDGETRSSAFRVMNMLHVTVRDSERTGELLGLALERGANQISNVSYTFSNPAELREDARELAMHSARATAEQLSALSGTTLGAPFFIEEVPSASAFSGQDGMMYAMESTARNVPVSGGELAVTVTLKVHFEIAQAP